MMALVSLLFTGFPCPAAHSTDQARTVTVGKEQSGQELRVKPGDMIRVELTAIAGTGYGWYLDKTDSEYLKLVSEETRQKSKPGRVGGPVTVIWLFRAGKEGSGAIKLDYFREWEGKEKSADHFVVRVTVTGR